MMSDDDADRSRRRVTRRETLSALGTAGMTSVAGCVNFGASEPGGPFKIGAVLALSQGWEAYGNTMLRAVEIGAEQMADNGPLAGRDVEVLVEDTQVDPQTTRDKAEKLITDENVDVIFGPISSANRIAMAPKLEEHEVPGLYGVEYEGAVAEDYCNPWLFKTAEIPPQQIEPFVPWLIDQYGSSFYLLGTDYTWPKQMNRATRTVVENEGGEILDEAYVPTNHSDFSSIIPSIEEADPDILFMTLTGPSVPAIQEQMQNFDVRDQWTEVGISHGQGLLAGAPAEAVEGVLSCHTYFETLDSERNQEFVSEFRDRGTDLPITFLTGTAHIAMQCLEGAISDAGDTTNTAIREGLRGVSTETIAGDVAIDVDHQATLPTHATEVNAERTHIHRETFDAVEPSEHCDAI